MVTEEPTETWEMEEWQKDTWNSLIPRMQDMREGWLRNVRQMEREWPDADSSDYYLEYHFLRWGWMPAVMEAMRRRSNLRAFRPMMSHATVHFPCGPARLWVDATASNHFMVRLALYDGKGHYDITPIGEGNAERTAECVETYLLQHASKKQEAKGESDGNQGDGCTSA